MRNDVIEHIGSCIWEARRHKGYSRRVLSEKTGLSERTIEKIEKGELAFWGCFFEDKLVGVISTKGLHHISLLFVKKEYQRKGIAKKLFQAVVQDCSSNHDITKITVHASPYSVEAYRHLGFRQAAQEQVVDGLRITSMEYLLQ